MKFRDSYKTEKKSKKTIYFVIIIIVLMVSSVIGYVSFSGQPVDSTSDYEFNGHKFNNINNLWVTKINEQDIFFDYLPNEVNNISYSNDKLSTSNKVYLSYDPSKKDASMDYIISKLAYSLGVLSYKINLACISEKDCPDIPVVSCETGSNILLLKIGSNVEIYKDQGCLVIEGKDLYELNKVSDRFIYSISGVI